MPQVITTLQVPNYASAPGSPIKGQIYYDTTTNNLYFYNGTAWTVLAAGAAFASLQTLGQNPAGSGSTAGVMMGLGGAPANAKITPTATGKLKITADGTIYNSSATTNAGIQLYYGTGTAPANGAALTGTASAAALIRQGTGWAANQRTPWSLTLVVTGLALGTQIWIDVALTTQTAGTTATAIESATISAVELP